MVGTASGSVSMFHFHLFISNIYQGWSNGVIGVECAVW